MKFQTNFEGYRNDLAKNLKEKRSESKINAQDFLATEKETDKYQLSRDIKLVSNELKGNDVYGSSKLESDELSDVIIEEIDINNLIPESVKTWLDKMRLYSYNKKFEHPNSNDGSRDQIQARIKEKKENVDKILKIVNEITCGDLNNPERLVTVINAWGNIGKTLERDANDLSEQHYFELTSDIVLPVWFSAGGTSEKFYRDFQQTILIANPRAGKFIDNLGYIKVGTNEYAKYVVDIEKAINEGMSIDEISSIYEKALKTTLPIARKNKEDGACFGFEKAKWKDIADWAINIAEGKVYKITNKES